MRRLVVAFTIVVAIGISSGTSGFAVASTRTADASAESVQADLNADFNNDGFADLAVGAPGESIGSIVNAGAVNVLYGSATGSTGTGSQFFTQNTAGVGSTAEAGDTFGNALGVGDFNNDGFADLAIGAAGESSSRHEVGAVNVLYGSAAGLSGTGSQFFTQDSPGVGSTAEAGDFFGSTLGVGDFDNDGFADLGVGVQGESIGSIVNAGAVNVLYGSATGLSGTGSLFFTQDSPGVGSTAEAGDFFGSTLGVGDFDNDGFADLAVGVPFESIGSIPDAGAVNVLPGSAAGLTGTGSLFFTQDKPGVGSSAETNDSFGFALAAGDFDNDGFADLAVGVPFESIGSILDAGAVNVLPGSAAGLTGTGSQFFTQDSPGVGSSAEESDQFGFALATSGAQGSPATQASAALAATPTSNLSQTKLADR
jgi:hypothetical protein